MCAIVGGNRDVSSVLFEAAQRRQQLIYEAVESAARLAARENAESPLDQQAARKGTLQLFKRLKTRGFGRLILGRRGRPTRLQLRDSTAATLMRDVIMELGVEEADRAVGPNPPATPKAGQALRRQDVLALLEKHQNDIRKLGVKELLWDIVQKDVPVARLKVAAIIATSLGAQ